MLPAAGCWLLAPSQPAPRATVQVSVCRVHGGTACPELKLCLIASRSPRVQTGLFCLFSLAAGLCPSGLAPAVSGPAARRVSLWFRSLLVEFKAVGGGK